ncbi:chromosome partitioning protein ParB [Rhodobacterales bacterium 52_120_T64]|nr:chromosome partitioning protein ParB [Rhodobacterales bacterium 52_120_T64]
MAKKTERKSLGRGLSALLADVNLDEGSSAQPANASRSSDTEVPIEKVFANPNQPRRTFVEKDLEDLTASIAEKGVIQPLIVRPDPNNQGGYQIVAGERRWRSAQRAKLHSIPVLIRELTDTEVLELAIIENIQRSDLNAVEEAMGYRQLMDKFGHTQEKMAEALGKSRSHIANLLRLLKLPTEVQNYLQNGDISAGHARALVPANEPVMLAREIISKGLSVRQAEALAKAEKPGVIQKRRLKPAKDADTRAIESDLAAHLGAKVNIDHKAGGQSGELRIKYTDLEQLDGLCQLLSQ